MRRSHTAASLVAAAGGLGILAAGALTSFDLATAADHTDGPMVQADQATDIADVFSFANGSNLVLAMTISNVQAAPQIQAGSSILDDDVLYQFNIDSDGDAVEDQVIQAFVVGDATNQVLHVRGPAAPVVTSPQARLIDGEAISVPVSSDATVNSETENGVSIFAGVREDPFFFDLGQFQAILGGTATGFNDPGTDTFAGLNVYAIVVEVPLTMLGGDSSALSVWGSTHR